MRLEHDPSDPDTLEERNRRWYASWLFWRAYGKYCPDPLTPQERADARWRLACKREAARAWLARTRAAQRAERRARGGSVVPFQRRR